MQNSPAKTKTLCLQWTEKFMKAEIVEKSDGFIFLLSDREIWVQILSKGFRAIYFGGYSDIEEFIEFMDDIEFKGGNRNSYRYVISCGHKKENDRLKKYFIDDGLKFHDGWRIFKEKEYLGDCEHDNELVKILQSVVKRYEGPDAFAGNSNEIVSMSTDKVKDLLAYTVNYDKDGNIKSKKVNQTIRNVEIVLQHDNRFAGKIRFNEFTRQDFLIGSVPWDNKGNFRAWNSHDDSALFSIVQSEYGLNSRNDFFDAIKNVSVSEKFHPIKDALESLKWDGEEHIRGLLADYLGAEDNEYTCSVMKLFMLGAVSRIYQPGCKFDYTMILQGPQGLGKSTFLQLLALSDEWFCDSLDSLDSDKAAQTLTGTWICEFGELKALARTAGGVDSVKRFLTATQDKYRMPYERRADIYLRQCVFSGTTNKTDFLQDETGNRRFLIVQTGIEKPKKNLFDISAMDDIRAAWAEAVHIYKTENPKLVLPEVVREEAERLQSTCLVDDGKVGIIEAFLKDKQRTCAVEIWNDALQESGRPAKYQASEINSIIESFPEWQRMRSPYKFEKYGNQRGFQRIKNYKDYKPVEDCSDFVEISKEDLDVLPFN